MVANALAVAYSDQIRMINDYGRFAITDKTHAGFFEGPNYCNILVPSAAVGAMHFGGAQPGLEERVLQV